MSAHPDILAVTPMPTNSMVTNLITNSMVTMTTNSMAALRELTEAEILDVFPAARAAPHPPVLSPLHTKENTMTEDLRARARRDISTGLSGSSSDPDGYRANRRRESIAQTWQRDERIEVMRSMLTAEPERFDATFGARGRLIVGGYEAAGRAAGAIADPDEAA